MASFLKQIDLFGIHPDFFINKNSRYRSPFGGFLTLLLFGSGIFLFIVLGNDMLYSKNPEIISSDILNSTPSRTAIGKNDYYFILGLQDASFTHFYDESIYELIFQQVLVHSNETSSERIVTDIPFERCTEEHLPEDMKSYFLRAPAGSKIQDLICIKKGLEYQIEGAFDSFHFEYTYIAIKTCSNSTIKNITCKSQEEIVEKLQQGFFAMYSTDYMIDGRNHENPGVKIGRDYYIPTTPNMHKTINKFLATHSVVSDEGWILNDQKIFNYDVYFEDKESFEFPIYKPDEQKTLIDVSIRKSTSEKIYTRKYKKVQNVFADMGGFMNIIFLFLYLISEPINSRLYYQDLANKLFNFEKDGDLSKLKNTHLHKAKTILEEINVKRNSLQEDLKVSNKKEKVFQYLFKSQDIPLKLTVWSIIKGFFKKNEKVEFEKKQRDSAMNAIFDHLDISYLLKKILEIEKIKILLLNENQYHLFELMPKPLVRKNGTIQIDSNQKKPKANDIERSTNIFANKNYESQAKMIQEAYNHINNKNEKNELDERLLKLIDEDLKNNFKEALEINFSKFKPNIAEKPEFESSFHSVGSEKARDRNNIKN